VKLFRAQISEGYGDVEYLELEVLRETPRGWWFLDPRTGKRRWTSGKYASETKGEALERLKWRTLAYLKNSSISFCDAVERCRSLGVAITPEVTRAAAPVEALAKEVYGADWRPLAKSEEPEEGDLL